MEVQVREEDDAENSEVNDTMLGLARIKRNML